MLDELELLKAFRKTGSRLKFTVQETGTFQEPPSKKAGQAQKAGASGMEKWEGENNRERRGAA
ncbi:hypothetical protein [Archaeoglobus sp.]